MIVEKGRSKVGILGFSFKAGTDDLRESPLVDVIEHLLGKGYELKVYDRNVNLSSLTGANQSFILGRISHISKLMVSEIDDVLNFAEVIVIGNAAEEFRNVPSVVKNNQIVVDLAGISTERRGAYYDGVCW